MKNAYAPVARLWVVCFAVVVLFIGVGARLVDLQVLQADRLASEVERVRKGFQTIKARRGEIRDSNGSVLATSRTLFDVGVDPHLVRTEDEGKAGELARVLNLSEAVVLAAFRRKVEPTADKLGTRPVRWTKLAEAVDERTYDQALALAIKGVYGNRQFRRAYPGGALAAHIIGFVNHEGTAAMGIEQYLDFYLTGQDGWREIERDGRKHELAQFRAREVAPADGYNVILSIDSFVQHCIETEMRAIARKFDPIGATIIVSDPRDGFILGMANYPTFDLNNFNKSDLASQRNRAVTDIFEPGSTFKIVPASAALNEGLVTPETEIDCGSSDVSLFGRTLQLPRDTHDYGMLTVEKVVTKSSNRGAARLGLRLGAERLYDYAAAFGFGERAGFSLSGEVSGMLHPVNKWDGLTITRLPMGHAIGATPLQVHSAMAAIANDGVLMRPQVVRRVIDRDGATVFEYPSMARRRVVRSETAQTMARLLKGVAGEGGTAPLAAIPGFEVAGKTGTTQKIINNRYSNQHHVGSFVGFLPASRPRLVISVIIDDARLNGTAYGATVAGPSFKNIAEQLIQYLGISPATPTGTGDATVAGGPDRLSPHRARIR
jgi:cell division protein FtsI/penicillin-binding protein 2